MTKRKLTTAADLLAKLQSDPVLISKLVEEDAERQRRAEEWERAETPLVEELRTAGFDVKSVWDLVGASIPYSRALPILASHLQRPYPARVREGIARALAVPQSIVFWDILTRLYTEEERKDAKDGLAAAIAAAADDSVTDDVMSMAANKKNGPSRLLLLSALERAKDLRVIAALMELTADPELKIEAETILRRLGR